MRSADLLVSIVIPTKNRNLLLKEALASIATQSWPAIEAIIVDDGGDEDPAEVLRAFGTNTVEFRLVRRREHRGDAGGAQVARNLGFALSRGSFVMFLDDDDLLAPHCIERRVRALESDSRLDFSVSGCRRFAGVPREDDSLWWQGEEQDDLLQFLSGAVPWQTSGPLWRRRALDVVGEWDEALAVGQDYEFHVRALAHGLIYRKLDGADYFWRQTRSDSFSGFEAFKAQHRRGDRIMSFCRSIDAVGAHARWTPQRHQAAWREAVRLAVMCRLNGGRETVASQALNRARYWGCIDAAGYLEARTCIFGWVQLFGKIPAMAYLARRGILKREATPCVSA